MNMRIVIKKGEEIVNKLTPGQWANSCGDEECMDLIDGRTLYIESVERYNQNMECKNDPHRAQVVFEKQP